jgi:hypothetical protein
MLPHKHFLIAELVVFPVAFVLYPEKNVIEIVKWAIVGGFMSALVDLDIVVLVFLKSKSEPSLRPFRSPVEVYRKFKFFMGVIDETGVLKVGMKTHFIFSAFIVLVFYFFVNSYFLSVLLAIISHLISDLPHLYKILFLVKKIK